MNTILKQLAGIPYFRMSHLEVFFPNAKRTSLYKTVTRWTKKGAIIKLKKGYYVTKEYSEKHLRQKEYWYYLGNILRYPSYVSGVYALKHYNILTDITYPVTSITTKSTRTYTNRLGNFIYYSITPPLYIGYERIFYYNEPIYIATKAKALFDYLYLKYGKIKTTAEQIIARERLNLEDFTATEKKEFKTYCVISKNKILQMLDTESFQG
jgi:predicted transcriptional regulator of viral defense system